MFKAIQNFGGTGSNPNPVQVEVQKVRASVTVAQWSNAVVDALCLLVQKYKPQEAVFFLTAKKRNLYSGYLKLEDCGLNAFSIKEELPVFMENNEAIAAVGVFKACLTNNRVESLFGEGTLENVPLEDSTGLLIVHQRDTGMFKAFYVPISEYVDNDGSEYLAADGVFDLTVEEGTLICPPKYLS